MKQKGILYLVPTPIGNLEDMTVRAIRILRSVSLIGAEDTRKSSILAKHYEIETPIQSYHKFNEKQRTSHWLTKLTEGDDIALITDAGTPGISDPSYIFVKEAIANDVQVCCLPGATAFIPALVASGLPAESFCFLGFLPEKKKLQSELLERVKTYPETLIFYEAPHRLLKSLEVLKSFLGDREIVVARELSKIYETYARGRISDFLLPDSELVLKGEFVVLIEGAVQEHATSEQAEILLRTLITEGMTQKELIPLVVQKTGLPKNQVYQLILEIKRTK